MNTIGSRLVAWVTALVMFACLATPAHGGWVVNQEGECVQEWTADSLARGPTAIVNATSRVSSAKICSGVPVATLSSVGSTDPSIEFSIGTQA